MRNIPCIKLSEDELKYITSNQKIFFGAEGIICESNSPYTLYKLFPNSRDTYLMSDNKEKKILRLFDLDLDYITKPLSLISFNGDIIGYEMVSGYDFCAYKDYQLDKDELVYLLKETKKILEYFDSKDVIYGDLEFRNILFNRFTKEIMFCDMDNVQVGELSMDVIPFGLMEYESVRGIDEGVHPFMHNRLTLRSFDLDPYCSTKYDLKRHFKRGAFSVFKSMKDPNDFDSQYLISYIKKYK